MSNEYKGKAPSRRAFLRGAAAASAGVVAASSAKAATPDPLITEIQPWAQELGDGVDAVRYGLPIEFEGDVVRSSRALFGYRFAWLSCMAKRV